MDEMSIEQKLWKDGHLFNLVSRYIYFPRTLVLK